jgi:hypothetical protein
MNAPAPTTSKPPSVPEPGPDAWWMYAACAGHDPEWWSDDLRERSRAATICATCPVRIRCLEEALEHADVGVVRGGALLTTTRHGFTCIPLLCQRCGVHPIPFRTYLPRRTECLRCRPEIEHSPAG